MIKFWFDVDNLTAYRVFVLATGQGARGDLAKVHDTDMPATNGYVIPAAWLADDTDDAALARKDDLQREYEYKRKRLDEIRQWLYHHEKIVSKFVTIELRKPTALFIDIETGDHSGLHSGAQPTNSNIDFIPDPTEGRF